MTDISVPGNAMVELSLNITVASDGAVWLALTSPAGVARQLVTLPWPSAKVAETVTQLGEPLGGSGRLTPIAFGTALFGALFTGAARSRYDATFTLAARDRQGVRIRLSVHDAPLAALPWELLYDAERGEFLALSQLSPLVRGVEQRQPLAPFAAPTRLRILALAASPEPLRALDIAGERARLEQAVALTAGAVELGWVDGATWRDLQDGLLGGPWHVFHFIGHGYFDEIDYDFALVLANEQNQAQLISLAAVARLVADHPSLRLVVLNACQGAQAGAGCMSLAQVLAQGGVPAVLAMQYPIGEAAALEFARVFYAALAFGHPVDVATSEARKAMSVAAPAAWEWATPMLFMGGDGMLWGQRESQQDVTANGDKKQAWWEQVTNAIGAVDASGAGGDVVVATIGAGAKNVAVGKGNVQQVTEVLGQPQHDDRTQIAAGLQQMSAALADLSLTETERARAEARLEILQDELTKSDGAPDGSMIGKASEWLFQNVPALTDALTALTAEGSVTRGGGSTTKGQTRSREVTRYTDVVCPRRVWVNAARFTIVVRIVTRYTDIACPRRVWVNAARFTVVVRMTMKPSPHSAASKKLTVRESLPLMVRVDAPDFDLLSEPVQKTTILPDRDSLPVVFDLRPRRVGHTSVTLDCFQNGEPVGTTSVAIEVTPYEVSESTASQAGLALQIEPDVAPPDRVLHIAWNRQDSTMQFTLIQDGGASMRTFAPVAINGDPAAHAAQFYRQITSLVGASDPTVEAVLQRQMQIPFADVDRRIKRLGQALWRELIPEDLKTLYASERENWRNRSLLIYSDEPHFPWELVWPYAGGGWQDEAPWSATLRLTRWLRKDDRGNGNAKAPGKLAIQSLAVLSPTYSLLNNLPNTPHERESLLNLARQHNLRDVSPVEPTWRAVMDFLEAGGYDWLHIAAHGNFYAVAPDADSALWLQQDNALTPEHIAGMEIEGYLKDKRPAFFFNACEVGRQGWALTHIGGWANRLISCGAGMFVGPLWSVQDGSALTFANAFYGNLLRGETVGSATQQARQAAKQIGDPTWLAYSVYAHPNARI